MALYNEILVGRFNRALQKVFGLKGKTGAPQLAGEMMPVLPFFWGSEARYLEGWSRFATTIAVAAVAANNSAARLRNPSGSNVIAVLEKIVFTNSVPFQPRMEIRAVNTDLAVVNAMPNARFDARGAIAPTLINSSQNTAVFALTVIMYLAVMGAATGGFVEVVSTDIQELTLLPGDSITVVENTVNTPLNVVFWWRERFLEEPERT